jgi:hypothetical protein
MHPTTKEGRRSLLAGACLFGVLFVLFLAARPASAQIDPGMKGWAVVAGKWERGAADSVAWVDLATWKLVTKFDGSSAMADPQPWPWIPVAGDWDGDGIDSVQMFNSQTWKLVPAAEGPVAVEGEPEPVPWVPVAGDWDGRGIDSVRVVDLRDGSVHRIEEGPARIERYDPDPNPWMPVAGVWERGGLASIAQIHREGALGAWQVVAGDWDGDGVDTVALVHLATGELVGAAGEPAPLKAQSTALPRSLTGRFATGPGGCYTQIKNEHTVYKVFYLKDGGKVVIKITTYELWTCCPIDVNHTQYVCSKQLKVG